MINFPNYEITEYPNPRHGRARATGSEYLGLILHDPAITHRSTSMSVANYVNREGSGGWYHIIMDKEHTVQYVDPHTTYAGHAGRDFNRTTIGLCIAQQNVNLKKVGMGQTRENYRRQIEADIEAMREKGYQVNLIERRSNWYPWEITLDPVILHRAAALVDSYSNTYSFPKVICVSPRDTCVDSNMVYTDSSGRQILVGVAAHKQLVGASRMDISQSWLEPMGNLLEQEYGWLQVR